MMQRIWGIYFSPNGRTKEVVTRLVEQAKVAYEATAAVDSALEIQYVDATLPEGRKELPGFGPEDMVVVGFPTFAGRLPNLMRPFLEEHLAGSGAMGMAVTTYGGRAFEDSLSELALLMAEKGFQVAMGGVFCVEHAFPQSIAMGRPHEEDKKALDCLGTLFGRKVALQEKEGQCPSLAQVLGDTTGPLPLKEGSFPAAHPGNVPPGPNYRHLGVAGQPVNLLKAKPVFQKDACLGCGVCAQRCPMGSLHMEEGQPMVAGICIKCHACLRSCPAQAISFQDPDFLDHKAMLMQHYGGPGGDNLGVYFR